MNSFLFSAISLCLVASQCALAQYQSSTPSYGYQQQRKMAPTPQTYVQPQQSAYDAGSQYGAMEQSYAGAKSAGYGEERATAGYGKSSTGYSKQQQPASEYAGAQQSAGYGKQSSKYDEQYYAPMPFAWGYDINDGYGGAQYHKENGDEYGKRTGSYGYTDAYGVYRQVDYVADEHGFRATIKTNEPGTANESPASVDLHAYEPPSNYYAGNAQKEYSSAKQSSYGAAPAVATGYSAPAAAASASYGQQRQSAYSAPPASHRQQYQQRAAATPAYGGSKSAGYGMGSAGYQRQQAAASSYGSNEAAAQYLSSVIVPVYQKSAQAVKAAAPVVAAKRAY